MGGEGSIVGGERFVGMLSGNAQFFACPGEATKLAELFETTLVNMRQGLLRLDADLRVVLFNRRMLELTGFPADVVKLGVEVQDLIRAAGALGHYKNSTWQEAYGRWLARVASRQMFSYLHTFEHGLVLSITFVPLGDGGWLLSYQDATGHAHAESALAEQIRLFTAALANMSHGLCMFDDRRHLILCNPAYAQMYALPEALTRRGTPLVDILAYRSAIGQGPADVDAYLRDSAVAAMGQSLAGFRAELQDGRTIQLHHKMLDDGGYVAVHEDVTESIRKEARIRHMARHDALTGLPNRLLFREKMEEALLRVPQGESLALLCLDLDNFKVVNDTLGHPVGDALLRTVTARLLENAGATDTVARLGGDELVMIRSGRETPEEVAELAQRLLDALAEPCDLDGHRVVGSASIGIAIAPNDGSDFDKLLKCADLALYKAKADGRGTFRFFEPAMDTHVQERRLLELDLRAALRGDQFELYYQPLVDARSEEILGFEALLRWRHPTRGMVSPADFVPLAEEIGLIVPLGEWVMRAACLEAAAWPACVKLAVNLSPAQFKSRTLAHTIISALAASGLSPLRLELEITETALLSNNEATLETLHHLRGLGIRIAMDDFGTGYSSLSYLQSFPFDKIKIDRSFVGTITQAKGSAAIVKAVAGLGLSLGIVTTAEGVETAEQLRQIREQGCAEAQGYFFSPPLPAREARALLAGWTKRRAS